MGPNDQSDDAWFENNVNDLFEGDRKDEEEKDDKKEEEDQ